MENDPENESDASDVYYPPIPLDYPGCEPEDAWDDGEQGDAW